MKTLLENVEFEVDISDDTLEVKVPFWRMDIEIPEDLVEEIGRLYDYGKLPVTLPKRAIAPVRKNPLLELKMIIRDCLSKNGANEMLTYSFVSGKLIRSASQNVEEAYQLGNALSPELEYYRLTLTPSVLSKVHQNLRAGYDRFAMFEVSKTHIKQQGVAEEGVPEELDVVSLVYAVNDKKVGKHEGSAFYFAKAYLDSLAKRLGRTFVYSEVDQNVTYEVTKPFDVRRSAFVSDSETGASIGIVGEFTPTATRNFKLPAYCAGFEISTKTLMKIYGNRPLYTQLQKYPATTQDVTFSISGTTPYSVLTASLRESVNQLAEPHGYRPTVTALGVFQKESGDPKNVSYRLKISHPDRTLTTDEINSYVDGVVESVGSAVSATRV
jgi:phenylalanyl-tRNA synthetase beta chain